MFIAGSCKLCFRGSGKPDSWSAVGGRCSAAIAPTPSDIAAQGSEAVRLACYASVLKGAPYVGTQEQV